MNIVAMPRMRSNLAIQNRGQLDRHLTYAWLRLLEPTGWTMTIDLPFAPGLDEVSNLFPIEMLLWKAEPCPGPPTRDYPGAIENAAYRLIALGVLDAISAKTAMEAKPRDLPLAL